METRKKLEDYDFRNVRDVTHEALDRPEHGVKGTILLRIVEGAPVALYRHDENGSAELLIPRYDRFQYEGGFEWGYGGTGPQSLSHAIAALVYPAVFVPGAQAEKAQLILDEVVSRLPRGVEMDLAVDQIYKSCGEPELIE
ncbi:hypothetical protein C8D72_3402 [Kushneria indalinina DSM 14324]|uniref:Uncharacterized protein n=2 Tax=Kushneria indalinina TaxID=184067 RepID=A0A3D9DRI9_9GAMM|nr:hypothetical protein C8D72_3402 [Kushneria indalinina DSM 14324]